MKSPSRVGPRSDQKNFLIFGFAQFIRSSDLWMRWRSLLQRGSNGILQGSTPTTRAGIQWGSNHMLTGADRTTCKKREADYRVWANRVTSWARSEWDSDKKFSLQIHGSADRWIWSVVWSRITCAADSVAQWIRRETTNLEIAGSNPVGVN